jgi:serine/threonine protein kinase
MASQSTLVEMLRRIHRDQRRRWSEGKPRRAEEYLARYPQFFDDRAVIVEFLYTEFCLRAEFGESPTVAEYVARFPLYAREIETAFASSAKKESNPAPEAAAPVIPLSEQPTISPSASDSQPGHSQPGQSTQTGDPEPTRPTTNPREVGEYIIEEEVGRGANGIVYKARQFHVNRTVAVKMLVSGALADERERARFRQEAEAAGRLVHPNIVPIYSIGEHDGHSYIAMGFVDGESLRDRLSDGPLAPRDAATIVRSIALAVQYAHGCGIIHRDLKPHNILMDKEGQPHVTDFGLAKRADAESSMTASGQLLGTPAYMPPEQARGCREEINELVDIYALGATLYALLTGRPPFQGPTLSDVVLRVLTAEPVPPSKLQPSVPRDLETICLKCLRKEQAGRYATADALAADLARFLHGDAIRARRLGRIGRGWRWCRRNPLAASLSAAVAVLLVLVTLAARAFPLHEAGPSETGLSEDAPPAILPAPPQLAGVADAPRAPPSETPVKKEATNARNADHEPHAPSKSRPPLPASGAPAAAPLVATHGLRARYFRGQNFEIPVLPRVDKRVDFLWLRDEPDLLVANNRFSVKWEGWIKAPEPGEYAIVAVSDDGVRVSLDGRRVIDNWTSHDPTRDEASVRMTAKPQPIGIEYFQNDGNALITLRWSLKGRFEEQTISAASLFLKQDEAEHATVPMPENHEKAGGLTLESFDDVPMTRRIKKEPVSDLDRPWYGALPRVGSMRWSARIKPPVAGLYKFAAFSDDGLRISLGKKIVVDEWQPSSLRRRDFEATLDSSPTPICVEHFGLPSSARTLALRWIPPGSDELLPQMIPSGAWEPADGDGAPPAEGIFAVRVQGAIDRGQKFLLSQQTQDGAFGSSKGGVDAYPLGPTALATLALLKSGKTAANPSVSSALEFLRKSPPPQGTYESSLVLMALVAANELEDDLPRINSLTKKLVDMQTTRGENRGMWNYGRGANGGAAEDRSNTRFAILGLSEAASAKVRIKRKVWELAYQHFIDTQNEDGGWGYHVGDPSTGSMTSAAIASVTLCEKMLTPAGKNAAGTATHDRKKDIERSAASQRAVARGVAWLDKNFSVTSNPGHGASWGLYYLDTLARAARLSGRRFIGHHDWYREGATYLCDGQAQSTGAWQASFSAVESDKVIASSFALLFLAESEPK